MSRTEIKIKAGTQLELNFKGSAVIYVVEDGKRSQLHETSYYYPIEAAIEPAIIQALTQDILNYGLDDSDVNGNLSKFTGSVIEANKRQFAFHKVIDAVRDTIGEMGIEGGKMGSVSKRLKAAERFIIATAEDAYTQPAKK